MDGWMDGWMDGRKYVLSLQHLKIKVQIDGFFSSTSFIAAVCQNTENMHNYQHKSLVKSIMQRSNVHFSKLCTPVNEASLMTNQVQTVRLKWFLDDLLPRMHRRKSAKLNRLLIAFISWLYGWKNGWMDGWMDGWMENILYYQESSTSQ